LVLGSIAPDVDTVLVARGWDIYLRFHEAGTHTLAASPLLAAAVATVVKLAVGQSRFLPVFLAAWGGVAIGHIGFDLVSGSDIRTFAPFSSDRLGWHLLTMGDLLAVAVLVGGSILTFKWRRGGALATLLVLVALLGSKVVTQRVALDAYTATLEARGEQRAVRGRQPDAVNGSWAGWYFYDRYAGQVRRWWVDARRRTAVLDVVIAVPPESSLIAATREVSVVRNFLPLADIPFPRIQREGNGRAVFWSDARFCDRAGCSVSFGALIGPDSRPMLQIIQIGGYRQTREIGR
jgi:hypothetical protein